MVQLRGMFHIHLHAPFYTSQEVWTPLAVIVALITPWIVNWLANKPKRSRLIFKGTSIVNQDQNPEAEDSMTRLLNVGRVIIKNEGGYVAKSVEAYIDRIKFDGEFRADFFPIPLFWTHGQLNKNGPTVRDIYPNQTVYLDLFNHLYNTEYVKSSTVVFAVAAGQGVENLEKMNLGRSELYIKFYQESGQVDELCIEARWDQKTAPTLKILSARDALTGSCKM